MSHLIRAFACVFVLWPAFAAAAPYHVRFCIDHDVVYNDNGFGEDFVTTDADLDARGILVRVIRNSDGATVWYDYTDEFTLNAGCTPTLDLYGTSFTVRAYSRAKFTSDDPLAPNYLDVRMLYSSVWVVEAYDVATAYVPPTLSQSVPMTVTFDLPVTDRFNVLAIAEHALYWNDGGLTGTTFPFRVDSSLNTAWTGQYIQIAGSSSGSTGSTRSRFVILHEMGHALAHFANLDDPTQPSAAGSYRALEEDCGTAVDDGPSSTDGVCSDPNETLPYCYNHSMNEKEYHSAAFWEGWAHFYAAISLNDILETDCTLRYYKLVDWDMNGSNNTQITNCAGSPMTGVSASNYVENECPSSYSTGCTSGTCPRTSTNRGTEYDWLRFLWAMATTQGVSFDTLVSVVDEADPGSWRATDFPGIGIPPKPYPAAALQSAAQTVGVGTEWTDISDDHGVDP